MRTQAAYFVHESMFTHRLGALHDSVVKLAPRQIKPDLHAGNHVTVAGQARRIRSSGYFDDFKRADGPPRIMRIHTSRGLGILGLELLEQRGGAFLALPLFQTLAHLGIGAGEGDVVNRCTCVQS